MPLSRLPPGAETLSRAACTLSSWRLQDKKSSYCRLAAAGDVMIRPGFPDKTRSGTAARISPVLDASLHICSA